MDANLIGIKIRTTSGQTIHDRQPVSVSTAIVIAKEEFESDDVKSVTVYDHTGKVWYYHNKENGKEEIAQ